MAERSSKDPGISRTASDRQTHLGDPDWWEWGARLVCGTASVLSGFVVCDFVVGFSILIAVALGDE